jgi:glycosyltransferase involved in cell wall biosynthesis
LQKETQDMSVIWHGKIDNTQVQKAYHSFDVMVHPTICLEVFGLTLLESLSSGRAVIATRCGGPEDFIEDGVDGFLVAPNDADQLAQAIKKFLDEPSLVEKMAKTIKPINTLENHTTDLEKLYKQVGLEE